VLSDTIEELTTLTANEIRNITGSASALKRELMTLGQPNYWWDAASQTVVRNLILKGRERRPQLNAGLI
jgi:hypothetical protein